MIICLPLCYEGKTLIVKSGHNGHYLTKIEVEVERKSPLENQIYTACQFIMNKNIAPDPAVERKVATIKML